LSIQGLASTSCLRVQISFGDARSSFWQKFGAADYPIGAAFPWTDIASEESSPTFLMRNCNAFNRSFEKLAILISGGHPIAGLINRSDAARSNFI